VAWSESTHDTHFHPVKSPGPAHDLNRRILSHHIASLRVPAPPSLYRYLPMDCTLHYPTPTRPPLPEHCGLTLPLPCPPPSLSLYLLRDLKAWVVWVRGCEMGGVIMPVCESASVA
jgi:hypothetical protein